MTDHPISVQKCEFVRQIGTNSNRIVLRGEIAINGQVKKPVLVQLGVASDMPGAFATITPSDRTDGETVVRSSSSEEALFSLAPILLSEIPHRQFSLVVSTDIALDPAADFGFRVKDIVLRVSRNPS